MFGIQMGTLSISSNPSGPRGHKSLVHIQSTRKQASLCLPDNKTHFSLPLDHGLYHIFSGSYYNNKKVAERLKYLHVIYVVMQMVIV